MSTENVSNEQKGNELNPLLGAVLFKQITYKIIIGKTIGLNLIPVELRGDFLEWIQAKSVELGLGKHYEYYYDHDETGESYVEVEFFVHCT